MLKDMKKKDLNGTIKNARVLLHSEKDGIKVSHLSFLINSKITVIETNRYNGDYAVIGYYQADDGAKERKYIEDILKVDWLLKDSNIVKVIA